MVTSAERMRALRERRRRGFRKLTGGTEPARGIPTARGEDTWSATLSGAWASDC
jgi:hypothetical protein